MNINAELTDPTSPESPPHQRQTCTLGRVQPWHHVTFSNWSSCVAHTGGRGGSSGITLLHCQVGFLVLHVIVEPNVCCRSWAPLERCDCCAPPTERKSGAEGLFTAGTGCRLYQAAFFPGEQVGNDHGLQNRSLENSVIWSSAQISVLSH